MYFIVYLLVLKIHLATTISLVLPNPMLIPLAHKHSFSFLFYFFISLFPILYSFNLVILGTLCFKENLQKTCSITSTRVLLFLNLSGNRSAVVKVYRQVKSKVSLQSLKMLLMATSSLNSNREPQRRKVTSQGV